MMFYKCLLDMKLFCVLGRSMLVRERTAHFVPDDPVALAFDRESYYFHDHYLFLGVDNISIPPPLSVGGIEVGKAELIRKGGCAG